MINEREFHAMVLLLDDSDPEVVGMVETKIISLGEEAVPLLESLWSENYSYIHQEKIEDIIHTIQFEQLKKDLAAWVESEDHDLFSGVFLLTKYQYPSLDKQEVSNKIDKIKLDAWLEMHYDLTALEKIRILNHIFYDVNGFKGNVSDYHSPFNSFINIVLESRQGNPISLAVIYSIVAQRLGVPVFGINLPQHFVLAYAVDKELDETTLEDKNKLIKAQKLSNVLFYINPFNKGLVFTRQNIDEFIKQLKIEPQEQYYLPCSNIEILKRVIRNLASSYARLEKKEKVRELSVLMEMLGGKIGFEEDSPQ